MKYKLVLTKIKFTCNSEFHQNIFSVFRLNTVGWTAKPCILMCFFYAAHIKNNNYKNTSHDWIYSHLVQHQQMDIWQASHTHYANRAQQCVIKQYHSFAHSCYKESQNNPPPPKKKNRLHSNLKYESTCSLDKTATVKSKIHN